MGDTRGQLLGIVGHHDECLTLAQTKVVDDTAYLFATLSIKSMERFIENQQLGVLDEGTRQQDKALLATGQGKEGAVGKFLDAKRAHPLLAHAHLLGAWTDI